MVPIILLPHVLPNKPQNISHRHAAITLCYIVHKTDTYTLEINQTIDGKTRKSHIAHFQQGRSARCCFRLSSQNRDNR